VQRYVCVHGHFYQPPRENPWLEEIEIQDEAYPFHDWNERITEECYAANASSRILNGSGEILDIVNNYSRISYNFGPTLLNWMERHEPDVYRLILDADKDSQSYFGGHGSALAQVYNHMIMPLANKRDQRTQTIWGVRDFAWRFGREPEGMWLSETAVDISTLEALAEQKIRFTILEPGQAARIRPLTGGRTWTDVRGGLIDPRRPYRVFLPSGNRIDVFFYDAAASRAVAFESLLDSGESFARRLTGLLEESRPGAQLAHIATDGESYGHHHRFGEMALSFALQVIESSKNIKLTNYAQFLELCPPESEVEIVENTSWSCSHGVERWRSGCSCGAGHTAGWSNNWRGPLREALDGLRDRLAGSFERLAGELFTDPWRARDAYINIILDRSPANINRVLTVQAGRMLKPDETVRALKLLEMQRQAMLMYTSCGWFFEDIGRIETKQILEYAARAMQLARDVTGESFEQDFVQVLKRATSNNPDLGDGGAIYVNSVQPAVVDLPAVVAHYAMTSLFNGNGETARIYCYDVERLEYRDFASGRARLALGRARLTSMITREHVEMDYGVLHLGDHNLDGGVRQLDSDHQFEDMVEDVAGAFRRTDYSGTIRALDRNFEDDSYSLRSLFRDEQRRILDQVLDTTLADVEAVYRHLYEDNESLIRFLDDLKAPLPSSLRAAAEVVIASDLRRSFLTADFDPDEISRMFAETRTWGLNLDVKGLGFVLEQAMERRAHQFLMNPHRTAPLERLNLLVSLLTVLPFEIDLRNSQNDVYRVMKSTYPEMKARASRDDPAAQRWVAEFSSLGKALSIHVE
jgi:alpha-amylase/alpha-mannosidase (GH57 family)